MTRKPAPLPIVEDRPPAAVFELGRLLARIMADKHARPAPEVGLDAGTDSRKDAA